MGKKTGIIRYINGPVVKASQMDRFKLREMVTVGPNKLIGEVISIDGDEGTIQVYEETSGLKVGDEIVPTGKPLSVKLGPVLLGAFLTGFKDRSIKFMLHPEALSVKESA